jgi:hypothetical protein
VGGQLAGLRRWLGTNYVPCVLVSLAAALVWVAIWKVWLPEPGPGSPSRRSVTVALALLVLGVGSAVVGLFHERLGSVKLSPTGIDVELTKAEQAGAHELVSALGARNAPASAYVEGMQRYVERLARGDGVRVAGAAGRRRGRVGARRRAAGEAVAEAETDGGAAGLDGAYVALADRIAGEVAPG